MNKERGMTAGVFSAQKIQQDFIVPSFLGDTSLIHEVCRKLTTKNSPPLHTYMSMSMYLYMISISTYVHILHDIDVYIYYTGRKGCIASCSVIACYEANFNIVYNAR